MAVRHRIERSGIDGFDALHRGLGRRKVGASILCCAAAREAIGLSKKYGGCGLRSPHVARLRSWQRYLRPAGPFGVGVGAASAWRRPASAFSAIEVSPSALRTSAFELRANISVLLQELLGVLAALADAFAVVAEPRAGLLHQIHVDRQVQQVAFARDAFAVQNVELGLAEGRSHLVLDDLDLGRDCRRPRRLP